MIQATPLIYAPRRTAPQRLCLPGSSRLVNKIFCNRGGSASFRFVPSGPRAAGSFVLLLKTARKKPMRDERFRVYLGQRRGGGELRGDAPRRDSRRSSRSDESPPRRAARPSGTRSLYAFSRVGRASASRRLFTEGARGWSPLRPNDLFLDATKMKSATLRATLSLSLARAQSRL